MRGHLKNFSKAFGLFLASALLLHGNVFAKTPPAKVFAGVPTHLYSEKIVLTDDGVALKMIVLDNPGKPIVLMEAGLGAQGASHELPAAYLYKRGYSVIIGNWRGSVRLPQGYQMLGPRNGLYEVMRKDFPAHLRFVLKEYATEEQVKYGVTLLGHSMGGMMIMGALSDPALYQEFSAHVRSIVLFQSPHHVKYMQAHMKLLSKIAVPLLKTLKNMGIRAIDMHSRLMLFSKESKAQGGFKGYFLMPAIENLAIALTRTAFDPRHTGRQAYRRAFFKMPSYSIPVDLMESFATAVYNGGTFVDHNGNPLILPQNIRHIPVQLLLSTRDTLAPEKEQREYFNEIAASSKQLVTLEDFNHIESVLITKPEADFYPLVKNFMDEPHFATLEPTDIAFKIQPCATLLTRIKNALKLKP